MTEAIKPVLREVAALTDYAHDALQAVRPLQFDASWSEASGRCKSKNRFVDSR